MSTNTTTNKGSMSPSIEDDDTCAAGTTCFCECSLVDFLVDHNTPETVAKTEGATSTTNLNQCHLVDRLKKDKYGILYWPNPQNK